MGAIPRAAAARVVATLVAEEGSIRQPQAGRAAYDGDAGGGRLDHGHDL